MKQLPAIARVAATIATIAAVGVGAHAAWPAKKHVTVVPQASPARAAGRSDVEEDILPPAEEKLGPLEVGSMLPPNDHDDAPGGDSRNLPRPENSRRIFVSNLDAQGTIIRVYRRSGAVDDLARELGPKTVALGWAQVDSHQAGTLTFRRGPDLAIIRIIPAEDGPRGESIASLIEMPFRMPASQ